MPVKKNLKKKKNSKMMCCHLREKRKRSDSVLWHNPYTNRNVKRAT